MKRPGIERNPVKIREWVDRSRQRARDRAWEARLPRPAMRRTRRKSKARIPEEIREAVLHRSGGRCVRPGCPRPASHVHHWLDEALWPELAKVESNLSGTCPWCNWGHHQSPGARLPYEAIPDCTLRLAARLGPRAQSHLQRYYPAASAA